MSYIVKVLEFLNKYSFVVLPVIGAMLALFGVVNWLHNPYRKQNKRMRICIKAVRAYPDRAPVYAVALPGDYRRQWRAFVNCGTDRPSLVFEFVPKARRLRGVLLFVVSTALSLVYVAVFALVKHNYAYLVFQCAYFSAFGLIMIANNVIANHYERHAKQMFAHFVALINKVTPKSSGAQVEHTVRELKQLNRHEVDDEAVGKASELLHSKGLNTNRTVEQQRRLNRALNSLLQAYARGAKQSKA